MPCDSIQINQVNLSLADRDILLAALKSMGARVIDSVGEIRFRCNGYSYSIRDGRLVGPGSVGQLADQIKREYSAEALHQAADRFGWTMNKTSDTEGEFIRRF